MTALQEPGALKQQFKATLTLGAFIGEAKVVLAPDETQPETLVNEGLKRGIQVQMDMGDTQQLGAALRGADSATASKMNEERQKKQEKKAREARRLQALLDDLAAIDIQIAELVGQIDELNERIEAVDSLIDGLEEGSLSVEDALQHPEVIEALRKSGKTIDPNDPEAADALAAILATHGSSLRNERDGLQGQLDGLNRRRDDIVNDIKEIDNDLGLSLEDKRAKAAESSSEGWEQADVVSDVTQTVAVKADGFGFLEDFRNDEYSSDHNAEQSNAALDDLFGDDSALDFASDDFGKQFSAASPPVTTKDTELASNIDFKLNNGMG
ncbi:hypothetical protein [Roseobacter litoralis]|uniref:Uncharacterized protein n=1 Tax=Roseobacter litoralis (strain ATCC 49566 / DSM 6996 / JCM 21268 / NBRC 15278 / OCh 149) TaxID=391595 RepID=F7ZB92_ROSLO|nr:hypothetical protein [Roseobacter litoralis]AEI93085.1 hypothetical protein RLO149_c010780 [Roseobacter litoralis Och 149]